jgi:predicted dehydrogenase
VKILSCYKGGVPLSLKYAIIGCGRISPNHIAAALENKLDIVALCDIDESKMNSTVQNFNLPNETKKYLDYKEMLNNEKPELVAVW